MALMKLSFLLFFGLLHISWAKICSGCERDRDVNDPTLVQFLDKTLSQYTADPQGTENEQVKLIKIKKISTQVISGIKYTFDFEAKGVKSHHLFDCQLILISQKWRGAENIVQYSCKPLSPSRPKRSLPVGEYEIDSKNDQHQLEKPYFCAGCPVEINLNDEQANQCLRRTLFNLNTKSQSQKQWKLVRIVKIQSQVVAGIKYTYDFEAEDENQTLFLCRSVIVSQPWISKEPLIDDFECVPESH